MTAEPPRASPRRHVMAGVGALTGLISSLPSPLAGFPPSKIPRSSSTRRAFPLHAGIAFGAGLAAMLWLWANRDLGKCLLAMALMLMGWLAAVNTANDVMSAVVSSELFGTPRAPRRAGRSLGGCWRVLSEARSERASPPSAPASPRAAIRRAEAWVPIVATGALFGLLLYPAASSNAIALLFVPWQAAVAASIAYALTRHTA